MELWKKLKDKKIVVNMQKVRMIPKIDNGEQEDGTLK